MKVPYLRESQIEREAQVLLSQYCIAAGSELSAPIPVEKLLEQHLRLSLGFDDLHARFGVPQGVDGPDVLGALLVECREVLVHETLDPDTRPFEEGRFRFTLAHEVGHWQLHRNVIASGEGQLGLCDQPAPPIICLRSQAKERHEWQADKFAAHLLMPAALVSAVWRELHGNQRLIARTEETLRSVIDPLARRFNVSRSAMRIRCEQLQLLFRDKPAQPFLTVAS